MEFPDGSYRDEVRCRDCIEKCCVIYGPWEQFQDLDPETRRKNMLPPTRKEDNYKVEPLFDPTLAHAREGEEYRLVLASCGLDVRLCEYCDPTVGCIIDWDLRPIVCRVYRCSAWVAEDYDQTLDEEELEEDFGGAH